MIDPDKILRALSKGGLGAGLAGGLLSGGLLGGKKKGGKLLKLGTVAAVGAVAYKAYQAYQQNQGAAARTPTPAIDGPSASSAAPTAVAAPTAARVDAAAPATDGLTLLRAMIAAAKADGQVDAAESQRIMAQVGRANLSAEEQAFLLDELAKPLDLDAVIAGVRTPQQAAEVYAASRLVIADASAAEQAYLGLLAARLNLDAHATRELDGVVQALPG
jgi:uncharacterized membrane protein YebE (DUF533 family)